MLDSTFPMLKSPPPEAPTLKIPTPVLEVVAALSELGGPAWLVGEGLADALRGHRPCAFQICAASPVEAWLARFPHAVPTRPADAVVMIPTSSGPIDVTAPRRGKHVQDDLQQRCFTIHALAWNPIAREWLDPFGGQADARAKLLRTVGDPVDLLVEHPIRALRAARLTALLDYRADPALKAALRGALQPLTPALRRQIRRELTPLLLAPRAGSGVELLRESGLEEILVPGAQMDAAGVIDRLPPVLAIRLAAWLRGSHAAQVLARLRVGRDLGIRVQRLLRHHPIDAAHKRSERALRRLDDEDVAALFALRRAELSAAQTQPAHAANRISLPSPAEIDRLEAQVKAARGAAAAARKVGPLALDGAHVMKLLGCGPGPHVGKALAFVASCVAADSACNSQAELSRRLVIWAQPDVTGDSSTTVDSSREEPPNNGNREKW